MNILLIGFGKTGQEIAKELDKSNHKIFFNSPSKKESKFSQVSLDKIPKNIDCIIFTLSTLSNEERKELTSKVETTYDLRHAELNQNINAIKEYIPFLKKIDTKLIVVVSNPIDEITNYLFKKLPNKEIFGFGMQLDVKRFSKALNKEIDCVGLHGLAIPLINSKSNEDYEDLSNKVDKELFDFVNEHGIPHKVAGKEFVNFFEKLTSKKEEIIYASHYLKQPFYETKNIAISLPFRIRNTEILGIKQIQLNDIEKRKLVESVKRLNENLSGLN
jgi:malate/lactate dehydrogenase